VLGGGVSVFDDEVGLGVVGTGVVETVSVETGSVEAGSVETGSVAAGGASGGGAFVFHCVAIADGTRRIAPGSAVSFRVACGLPGAWEARDIETVER